MLFYLTIVEFILPNMTPVLDMCVVHLTSDNRISLRAKTMAVFGMYMSIRVHVRFWSTAPLISGFKSLKAKAENCFWYGQFGLDI